MSQSRTQIISSFGPLPADVLVVSEAPNRTEELFGRPLAGPDARLFRELVEESAGIVQIPIPSIHLVSLVLCRAHTEGQDRPAKKSEVLRCMTNIIAIKELCAPKLIVLMGENAQTYYGSEFEDPVFLLPCWFIRRNPGHWINAVSHLAEGLRKC